MHNISLKQTGTDALRINARRMLLSSALCLKKDILMYFAYDGDKVGRKLESLLIDNNELQIVAYAKDVSLALKTLENALTKKNCRILFASGDSVLAKSMKPFNPDDIQRTYGDITFSLGIGKTPLEAMLALKKAKANGFGNFTTHELTGGSK